VSLSISHRGGLALCAVANGSVTLGCDVELVEPRSQAFLADFLTPAARAAVAAAAGEAPGARSTGVWRRSP